ncbi:AsmA family protein [Candidatus Liberibacter brunswickensis]|uniref:AsmA family protein n=1 Tax=Candidatus Liberibacter brunswickensis TaxID=1968796 RepID=UPI002FE2AAE8
MRGRILICLGLLFSILLVFAIPLFIDWTDFRKKFELQASSILGKTTVVKGGMKIRILPFPSITLKDIRIDSKQDGSFGSKIEDISINMDFLSLLRGKIRVFVNIDQPYLNFDLSSIKQKDFSSDLSNQIKSNIDIISNISFGKVSINGGKIRFIDQISDQSYFLSDLNFQIYSNHLNIVSPLSINSLKGSITADGIGSFNNKKSAFKITANFPAVNNAIPLKTQLFPTFYPFIINLSGNFFWNDNNPIYEGVFSSIGDFSKLLNLKLSMTNSLLVGNFKFSTGNIRISHYKFYSNHSDFSVKERDEFNALNIH